MYIGVGTYACIYAYKWFGNHEFTLRPPIWSTCSLPLYRLCPVLPKCLKKKKNKMQDRTQSDVENITSALFL